jgi:hypothetical protein
MTEDELFKLLKKVGELEMKQILESDEAFDKFLRENPLTRAERAQAKRAVERMIARLRKSD